MRPIGACLAAVLIAAPLLFIGLDAAFDDPGEGMHAEIARELVRSKNPFDLRLNGVAYLDKPPLLYVLLAGVFTLAGPTEAAARAVSAAAALLAVAATAWLGAHLYDWRAGLLAGLSLLSSAGFFAYGRYVRPDALFVAALALGFTLTLLGLRDGRRALLIGGLLAFGVAGLAKDPMGAVAPPLAIGLAALLARERPALVSAMAWPAAVMAVGSVAWWTLAERLNPGFTWYTVVDNHVLNVARARNFPDEDIPLSAVQFLVVALLAAAPWIVAAAVAIATLVRRRAWRDPVELPWVVLAIWAVGVLAVATISPFRLPHYGLPAYPAVALLAARGWWEHGRRGMIAAHALLFAALAVACGLAWTSDGRAFFGDVMVVTDVAARKAAAADQAAPLPAWEAFRSLFGPTSLVAGAAALILTALVAARPGRARGAAPAVVVVAMLAIMPAVAAGLARVSSHRTVRPLAVELARQAGTEDVIAHEGPAENSGALEWYSGRRPVLVDARRSVLGFGATLGDSTERFWEPRRLETAWNGPRRVWVVTTRAPERSVAAALPGARLVAAVGGRWLYVNR